MFMDFCDGSNTLIESKLHEAFTIICIRLPQDFVIDFQLVVRREAAQEMGVGPSVPARRNRLQSALSCTGKELGVVCGVQESQGLRSWQVRVKETRGERNTEDVTKR
jgi:hypothetical protein